jgi:hypothetical protein
MIMIWERKFRHVTERHTVDAHASRPLRSEEKT